MSLNLLNFKSRDLLVKKLDWLDYAIATKGTKIVTKPNCCFNFTGWQSVIYTP